MKEISYKMILEKAYLKALDYLKEDDGQTLINSLGSGKEWLINISDKVESLKAIVTALTTVLVKKIENPKQDIRYHKHELKNGYSGRTIDTNFITPFFKERFRRLAMKESGWLTRSIEQPHPFTLDFPGKIRDKQVKESFLQIINDVEINKADPEKYLKSLFLLLIKKTKNQKVKITKTNSNGHTSINLIVDCLTSHFYFNYKVSGASRLPVIAIYSIYHILISDLSRFKNKKLLPLKSHISSDFRSKAIGDVEILNKNGSYFEAVEIKHNKPIDLITIEDTFEKFKGTNISRYYILTTSEPNIKSNEEQKIKKRLIEIRKLHGCETIVNGLIPSIKYYLRLIKDSELFIDIYTKNLQKQFSKTTEIKEVHLKKWKEIIDTNL